MALAVIFYTQVADVLTYAILIVLIVIEVVALINCFTQRADACPVVGPLSKNACVAILLGSLLATVLCWIGRTGLSIFAFAAITAAAIYMLDVRPALRDVTDGSGNW